MVSSIINELTEKEELLLEKNLVWVFGFPKNAVIFLSKQLSFVEKNLFDEPLFCRNLGKLRFGMDRTIMDIEFFEKNPDYLFAIRYYETWRFYLRKLILNRIYSQFQDLSKKIIINEPEGISACSTISQCLPNSKMILVLPSEKYAINSFSNEIQADKSTASRYKPLTIGV